MASWGDLSFDSFIKKLLEAAFTVDAYYTPFLCLFGALGNSLSVAVFCFDSKYRNQSSSYYLSALAVSDTGFLLNLFLVWLQSVYGNVITTAFTCPLVMFLGQVTCFMSVYLMVAFSIERYIAVHYPFARQRYCTRENSRRAILVLLTIALIMFSYVWVIAKVIGPQSSTFTTHEYLNASYPEEVLKSLNVTEFNHFNLFPEIRPENLEDAGILENVSWSLHNRSIDAFSYPHHCTVPPEYYRVSEIANYLDSIVTLIIPFTLITFLNIKIYISLWKYMQERQKLIACPPISISIQTPDCDSTSAGKEISPGYGKTPSPASSLSKGATKSCSFFPVEDTQQKGRRLRFQLKSNTNSKPDNDSSTSTLEGRPAQQENRLRKSVHARYHQATPTDVKVTKTLLLVSTVFLVFNLPLHAIRCAQFIQYMSGTQGGMDILRAIQAWATQLFNTNFAVNFLLYCVSGRNFRQSLKRLVTTGWIKRPFLRQGDDEMVNRRYQVSPRTDKRNEESRKNAHPNERVAMSNTIEVYES